MRSLSLTPRPLLHLLTTILLSSPTTANPHPAESQLAGFAFNELFARFDCPGNLCGYNSQLCCTGGAQCYTDSNNQAQCGAAAATPAPSAAGGNGYWQYYTTTIVMTDTNTITSVYSSYIGGAAPTPAAGGKQCNYALQESPCGTICCASNQYCFSEGQCDPIGGGASSTYFTPVHGTTTVTGAGAPIRPTSSGQTIITATQQSPSVTSFMPAVETGSNVTLTESQQSGGLSGGAIAGIVIGVLVGLALLALLCFCCIVRGLWDIFAGIFGFGKKKRRVTEVEEYEHRSSHHAGGGRTWYGGAAKPSRTSRYEEKSSRKKDNRWLAWLGALGALWVILGLKRRNEHREEERRRKEEDRYTEETYSSYDYTSASSASSDDRRTRDVRSVRESRRSASRR